MSGVPLITFPDGMQLIFRLSIFHTDEIFIAALYGLQYAASSVQMTRDFKKLHRVNSQSICLIDLRPLSPT